MPRFIVEKLQDAYVRYQTVVDADNAQDAKDKVKAWTFVGQWVPTGHVDEYDHFDISDNDPEKVEDDHVIAEDVAISVSEQARDIIIAALRLWQRLDTFSIPHSIEELARNGRASYLSNEEIDELVESVNHD
ncbi:hypothetical protein [Phyllobacterium myrsinacearum]|uniref:Uncharacterized protein n=1 Tax=Phyllobacterium myrsinacearum TaxID=28101 RepID=A0A839EYT8_9HYPH|nr:hypothetical protein [Phyllobacterium myrsinacearum]MBA8881640.1 hypothetical protein [Phyllobacterium myrsinacearum]